MRFSDGAAGNSFNTVILAYWTVHVLYCYHTVYSLGYGKFYKTSYQKTFSSVKKFTNSQEKQIQMKPNNYSYVCMIYVRSYIATEQITIYLLKIFSVFIKTQLRA